MAEAKLASALKAKPSHVPDALVFPFDYNLDPGYEADPHARAAELLETAPPIFWTPHNGGHWVVLRYALLVDLMRDPGRFSNEFISPEQRAALRATLPEDQRGPQPIPVSVDPPLHTRVRAPLTATFSPREVKAMASEIEAFAGTLIDRIAPRGRCEFMHDIAEIFPVDIFLRMFGLPTEEERAYRELVKGLLANVDLDPAASMRRNRRIADIMRPTLLDRRERPRDDLISRMWSFELDGEPMTLDMMESYCVILFLGGLDTVVNALGFGVRHLASDPALQRALRAEPSLVANATDELLRRYAFVTMLRRVTGDFEFHGVSLRGGDLVMPLLTAAGLDPAATPDPTSLDIRRRNLTHLAFGAGPHFCLGAHLARLELTTMYRTILTRLPEFRLDPDSPPTFHTGFIVGPTSLHLVWDGPS